MIRLLVIAIVGMIALNIGMGAALLKSRFDAVASIKALKAEIQTRDSLDGGRRDDKGGKGPQDFREVRKKLGLNEEQAQAFRRFMKARRDTRKMFAEDMKRNEEAMRAAILSDVLDVEAIIILRDEIDGRRRSSNDEAFRSLAIVMQTMSKEQREAMLELAAGRPNSLLFL